ncbi:hypothetical protein CERZMDRAFT_84771 [Cercospora zeae-maydis SCOH1-5]|uniref:Uncharacterized protein n=1 Tax=Cercospora zeae-maydis SCOH1-5 TaxID=717836 RepID=A0A6A6FGJ5_9PEZI|nr:hypothetical protein CERZMDRAFT_84771 [Cercospora zeae-maydis SCOH1-5]
MYKSLLLAATALLGSTNAQGCVQIERGSPNCIKQTKSLRSNTAWWATHTRKSTQTIPPASVLCKTQAAIGDKKTNRTAPYRAVPLIPRTGTGSTRTTKEDVQGVREQVDPGIPSS